MWRSRYAAAEIAQPEAAVSRREQSNPARHFPQFGVRRPHNVNRWVRLLPSLCFVMLFALAGRVDAQTYSCGDYNTGHCYGVVGWAEQPQYFGVWSDILDATSFCLHGCGGFVNNEVWLADTQSPACASNYFGMCWVEVGYKSPELCDPRPFCGWFGGQETTQVFFWADARPVAYLDFHEHIFGPTDCASYPSACDVFTYSFVIIQDGRGDPGLFQAYAFGNGKVYNGTSTSNFMTANTIYIGQELAGTQDAYAATTDFTTNLWANKVLGPDFVFHGNPQTDTGSFFQSDDPPFAGWNSTPVFSPFLGGDFITYIAACCQ